MAMSLRELLERRFGVDEQEFASALQEFADRAGPVSLAELRPMDYFGEAQRTVLTELGASLQSLSPRDLGPIAGLAAAQAELVTESVTVAELAALLGVDPSRIRQRIYARSLYAFKHGGIWLIPLFQVAGTHLVPSLDAVLPWLHEGLDPVAVTRWFTSPTADLAADSAVSPIAWLSAGGPPARVAALAATVDEL